MTTENIYYKMLNLISYFTKYYSYDNNLSNLEIIINKLYELKEIETVVNDVIPTSKNIKGIAFQPKISTITSKLIYLLPVDEDAKKDKVNKHDLSNSKYESSINKHESSINKYDVINMNKPKYEIKSEMIKIDKNKLTNNQILTFKVKQTDMVDVYKLFLLYKNKTDNKTSIKNINIDIAYIPDIKTTELCKTSFGDDKTEVLMNCKYNKDKEVWIPIELNKSKDFASLINDFI